MTMRAALMISCGLLMATPAVASARDILIGLDAKITYDVNGPPGMDAVRVATSPTLPNRASGRPCRG